MKRVRRQRRSFADRSFRRRKRRERHADGENAEKGNASDKKPSSPRPNAPTWHDPPAEEPTGFWTRLKRFFGAPPGVVEKTHASVPPADDPLREILALPRGIPRLDAFENALASMPPGTHGHRLLTQGLYGHLTELAEDARVDLGLLAQRARRCAEALVDAGELEKAAELFARIGKGHRAAELFASTGAIEALEAVNRAEDTDRATGSNRQKGGDPDPIFKAHLAYQRFETYFAVGLRDKALDALKEALALDPENGAYAEIHRGVEDRLPQKGHLHLQCDGHHRFLRRGWPVHIGRAEDSHLQVKSPVVSREHAEIVPEGEGLKLVNLSSADGLHLDDQAVQKASPLPEQGTLNLGGVQVRFEVVPSVLNLWPAIDEKRITCCARSDPFKVPLPDGMGAAFSFGSDGRARIVPDSSVLLDGDAVAHPTLLLFGDALEIAGRVWRVVDTGSGF
jgi:tetratricopeptide (TPR) repeat protein